MIETVCPNVMSHELLGITFGYLAEPVIVDLTVPIIPVPSVVNLDFCTVFIVIVIIWFPIAPVLKVGLDHSWKYTLICHNWQSKSKDFSDDSEVLRTAEPSDQTKPVPGLMEKPIQAGSEAWNL